MDFDEIVVKESPGLCRCCLSEGCYKDMGTEYTWMNDNEVYADMLLECFDIGISQHNDGPNGPNRLICEVCITRLRDACNFKKQVLDSEKKFVDMIGRGEFRPKVLIYQSQMKAERNDDGVEDAEVEYLDEDLADFDEDDLPLKREGAGAPPRAAAEPLPLPKRGRPKKTAVKPEKKKKLEDRPKVKSVVKGRKGVLKKKERIREEECMPKITKIKDERNKNEGPDERTKIMRNNIVQVLSNSSVMPFRWLKSSYRCFYCYEVFQEPKDLKIHQEVHMNDNTKLNCMENYWESTVHVDVSTISCKLCPKFIDEFYDLIDHLITAHNISFNKDIGICMNPFKLNNISVQCALCGQHHRTFGHLLLHMNKEHKGYSQLLCDVCGRHCRNKSHLREHKKEHVSKTVTCTICGETLSSYHKLRPHMQNVHGKKYKCMACPELFETHYKRSLHMMTVHKSREEIKCQYCPKTFVFRSSMMSHLRVTHLQEKNTICGICGWRTVSKSKLKRHMSKHSNEKNYKCDICGKAFKAKKNMVLHQRNVHESDLQMAQAFSNSGLG